MKNFFHGLNPDELEAVTLLIEECGEVIQAGTKIIRHGLNSCNPDSITESSNIQNLNKEIGQVRLAIEILINMGILDIDEINQAFIKKMSTLPNWLHHIKPEFIY